LDAAEYFGAVIPVVESRFDFGKDEFRVRSVLGEARNVHFTPMSFAGDFFWRCQSRAGRGLERTGDETGLEHFLEKRRPLLAEGAGVGGAAGGVWVNEARGWGRLIGVMRLRVACSFSCPREAGVVLVPIAWAPNCGRAVQGEALVGDGSSGDPAVQWKKLLAAKYLSFDGSESSVADTPMWRCWRRRDARHRLVKRTALDAVMMTLYFLLPTLRCWRSYGDIAQLASGAAADCVVCDWAGKLSEYIPS